MTREDAEDLLTDLLRDFAGGSWDVSKTTWVRMVDRILAACRPVPAAEWITEGEPDGTARRRPASG